VEHAVHIAAGVRHHCSIAQITANNINALSAKLRIIATPKTAHPIAASQQRFNDVPAQKPAAASDKCVHWQGLGAGGRGLGGPQLFRRPES
jgi:hypothetical protein